MRNMNISARITFITCGILLIFMLAGGMIFTKYQMKMVDSFIEDNLEHIYQAIDKREKIYTQSLEKNVRFNTDTLSDACSGYLWQYIMDGLKETLRSYMNYPEIVAIQVVDDTEKIVAAAWKDTEIFVADNFPGNIKLENIPFVEKTLYKNKNLLGVVTVFYTDKVLKDELKNVRTEMLSEAQHVHNKLRSYFTDARKFQSITVLVLLTALVIGLLLSLKFLIFRPLGKISDITERLAAFDLTVDTEIRGHTHDEIGKLLKAVNDMVESFRLIISRSSESAEKVTFSAEEISSSVSEQAAVTAQQSSTVSEITSTMERLSESSAEIASNSNSVVEIAANTLNTAQAGARSVEDVIEKMDRINLDNQNNIREILALGKKAEEITKVMGIINGIADQTKLIAFNAALEAASAGKEGKRFGVVASEIRRLANSVMASTGEIGTKIQEIKEASQLMIQASEQSSIGIRDGFKSFSQTSELLEHILAEAESTTDAAKKISLATSQQKNSMNQVVVALKGIAEGAEHTSASINHISSVSKNLAKLSENSQKLIKEFTL